VLRYGWLGLEMAIKGVELKDLAARVEELELQVTRV